MPPFMTEIEAAQPSPIDQLARDFLKLRPEQPSIDFCRRTLGVSEDDTEVAMRLGVKVQTVREWREIGRRASGRGYW